MAGLAHLALVRLAQRLELGAERLGPLARRLQRRRLLRHVGGAPRRLRVRLALL